MAAHADPASGAAAGAPPTLVKELTGFTRAEFEDTCIRRFFFGLANDPYGGTAGLYDLGPAMCAMKANFVQEWRRFFITEEGMCELDLPVVTPEEVFKASGHVERFNDVMVRDTVTGENFRLDKLIEAWCGLQCADPKVKPELKEKITHLGLDAESMTQQEMDQAIVDFGIKSPKGNALSASFPFNLMFKTHIGPEGTKVGYLRPELAQGIILNFKRLIDTNCAQKMPFAAACIGQVFRNEIAPRACLIRVREFSLAEIEHFLNPNDKAHPKFASVKDVQVWALDRHQQEAHADPTLRTVGELHESGTIDNETLAYFIGRTAMFLQRIGVRVVRFRQHKAKEMAHYAQDCWDAELLTTYGWIECVGIADRSAFDLNCHIKATKKDLKARFDYAEPKVVRVLERKIDKGKCGKALGKDTGAFVEYVTGLDDEAALALDAKLNDGDVDLDVGGKSLKISRNLVTFKHKDEKQTGYTYTPSVVEPSFGIGRILYAALEQAYWIRRDDSGKNDKRAVFSFLPSLAPQKVAVLPLMMKQPAEGRAAALTQAFMSAGLSTRSDTSGGAIGRKYARVDEVGIPYAVTVDFEEDKAVTLRERDTGKQVRVPEGDVVRVVQELCSPVNPRTWDSVAEAYPSQAAAAKEE